MLHFKIWWFFDLGISVILQPLQSTLSMPLKKCSLKKISIIIQIILSFLVQWLKIWTKLSGAAGGNIPKIVD